jgi:hypothetical protein
VVDFSFAPAPVPKPPRTPGSIPPPGMAPMALLALGMTLMTALVMAGKAPPEIATHTIAAVIGGCLMYLDPRGRRNGNGGS